MHWFDCSESLQSPQAGDLFVRQVPARLNSGKSFFLSPVRLFNIGQSLFLSPPPQDHGFRTSLSMVIS